MTDRQETFAEPDGPRFMRHSYATVERVTLTKVEYMRGDGSKENPHRMMEGFFFDDGTLLVELDRWCPNE